MYPRIENTVLEFEGESELRDILKKNKNLIPFGNGRSYGDSALNRIILDVKSQNKFLEFDREKGILSVQSGVLFSEILGVIVPKGWFLTVTPGTKLITLGGAIASDVHGKNHHVEGCFSKCVLSFSIMMADGKVVSCSKKSNPELFRATCGGMGLTGVILDAKISLTKINSKSINQTTIKNSNLKETFEAFKKYGDANYSVAWIDCLANNESVGRSLLTIGEFRDDGDLDYRLQQKATVPNGFPSYMLNSLTVKLFNWFYYSKNRQLVSSKVVDIDTFFYPLDSIAHWNRIYGKNGFVQYQFILPLANSYSGLAEILKVIASSKRGSFLAVLKLYGEANDNYLSFPMKGYSLALDFKLEKGVFELMDRLNGIVKKNHGRIYLAKDACVDEDTFSQGYECIEAFRAFRKKHKMSNKFGSLQSKRVDI